MLFGEDVVVVDEEMKKYDDCDDNDGGGGGGGGENHDLSRINDIRPPSAFRNVTFSNYKKLDAKQELMKEWKQGRNIEPVCYWCAEFVCAGAFDELWEMFIAYMSKYVHMSNLKLPLYLEMRYNQYQHVLKDRHYISALDLRNNPKIRGLFAEIATILLFCEKAPCYETTKVDLANYFQMDTLSEKLSATGNTFADDIFDHKEDPKEIFIAVNEFAYHLCHGDKNANLTKTFFWIDWIVEFDIACRARTRGRAQNINSGSGGGSGGGGGKNKCTGLRRANPYIDPIFQKDVIWVFWECLFAYSRLYPLSHLEKTIHALYRLFSVHYRHSVPKRRKALLYFAVRYYFEEKEQQSECNHFEKKELVAGAKKTLIERAVDKIDVIYAQIKKNEVSPRTEYLFSNIHDSGKTEFEKSLLKMSLMNTEDRKQTFTWNNDLII